LSKSHSAVTARNRRRSARASRTTRTAVKRGFHSSTVVSSQVRSADRAIFRQQKPG
jgi:hypothetical protein